MKHFRLMPRLAWNPREMSKVYIIVHAFHVPKPSETLLRVLFVKAFLAPLRVSSTHGDCVLYK
jgi:hypothetical protein